MAPPEDPAPGAAGTPAAPDLTLDEALTLAMGLQKHGILDAAAEIYRRILKIAPDNVNALHFLGLAYHQLEEEEDDTKAIACISRAVELAPDYVDARNNLGNLLLEQRQLDSAEAAYRGVLARQPDHAPALTNLGTVQRLKDDYDGAETSFRRALELDPKHGEAYHQLGAVLRDTERHEESLAVFQKALELRPYDGESYRRIGHALASVGRLVEAEATYKRWLEMEPDNPTAKHHLAACSGAAVPERADDAYVKQTFDSFAESFDNVLTRLQYRAPALVADAVGAALGPPDGKRDILDAGAGTGMCGPLLRPHAARLVGVDLSERMLERAKTRAVYDALDVGELTSYMRERPGAYDVIVSADTLVYFGDLSAALAAATAALRPGGLLVFTVERADEALEGGFRINPHGRYSHTEPYVRATLASAGLTPKSIAQVHLRTESRLPVEGLLVTALRAPS